MAGTEILWDADPDTPSGIADPVQSSAAPSKKMTFLSSMAQSKGGSSDDGRSELHGSVGLVVAALAGLWLLGGVVFKDVRL